MSNATPQLYASLSVALGGGIGALARYQLGRLMTAWLGAPVVSTFPFATLAVNTLGSLLMGLLAGWLVRSAPENAEGLRLLLGVGLLGGFTTFSAFSLELAMLIQRGQVGLAAIYLMLSVGLGVTGFVFGLAMTRVFS
ncbi:fluoride efflux transporter CrcB [Erythrobacter alti]|uniref:fluoride efflux transporter CrcB n=1 Tax=Erythrobacter alti TaxID=1896145 RepID=UPI0030F440A6